MWLKDFWSSPIDGLVMSKMDGDARGGAAISIRSVTGIPIKFLGTGESLDATWRSSIHPDWLPGSWVWEM